MDNLLKHIKKAQDTLKVSLDILDRNFNRNKFWYYVQN